MRVAVLMGGRSGEHDVSLVTGRAVDEAVARLGLERFRLVFGRHAGASWAGSDGWAGEGTVGEGMVALERFGPDACFLAMHGADGEDGRVQGLLELMGIPYQGADCPASAVAMDKARTKAVYRQAGLPIAKDVLVRPPGGDWDGIAAELGLPVVLKTAKSGSSVGVEIADTLDALRERGTALLRETPVLVCERYVRGRELTVPVLEDPDGTPRALPVIEIRPHTARFFDYVTKYDPDAVAEICPAPIPDALRDEVQALGVAAHEALGLRDYSRTDLIVGEDGRPVLLETNTLPGLTPASLLPKAAREAGMTFDDLIRRLLELAAARRV